MTETQKVIKYCAIALAVVLIVAIIGCLLQAVGVLRVIFGGKDGDIGEMKTYEVSEDVRNLHISVSSATISIKTGEAFAVESNYGKLSVECDGGYLAVKDAKGKLFFGRYEDVTVILTVPEGFSFERVHIEAGAGNVRIDALTSERFCMELGAGNVQINRLNVTEETEIGGGTGNLSLTSASLHDLSMGVGVGRVTMEAQLFGECEIDCGVGTVDITLLGAREDYRITVEKGLGAATLNGERVSAEETVGNGKNRLEIHGGVGELAVRTENAE